MITADRNFTIYPRDFIYSLAFYNPRRLCFTGPTTILSSVSPVPNILYLKIDSPMPTGAYISNSTDTLDNLNFTTLTSDYQKIIVQKRYNQTLTIDARASYGDIIFQSGNYKLASSEFISQDKKIQAYDISGGIIHEGVYEFYVKNIKINLDSSL